MTIQWLVILVNIVHWQELQVGFIGLGTKILLQSGVEDVMCVIAGKDLNTVQGVK